MQNVAQNKVIVINQFYLTISLFNLTFFSFFFLFFLTNKQQGTCMMLPSISGFCSTQVMESKFGKKSY